MDELFNEKKGSWQWTVNADVVKGKVTLQGKRSGKVALELSCYPLTASATSLDLLYLSTATWFLAGRNAAKALVAGVKKIGKK